MVRKVLLSLLAAACASVVFASTQQPTAPAKFKAPPPIHGEKGVICSPFNANHLQYPRGLNKTPNFKIISAKRFIKPAAKSPASVVMLPKQLSMWGNDVNGDCVSASEAARKAAYSVYCNLPETFIPEATLIAWAKKFGYLNGADLTDVMTTAAKNGMVASDGKTYLDGPYTSVNFADEAELQAALAIGPVNFGIDADALPSAAGNQPGWYAFGGTPGRFANEDHCTPSFGYLIAAGSVQQAFALISQTYGVNVSPPANAPTGAVYFWFTWSTVGVVDHAWIMSTVGEAWVQNPQTVGQSPQPSPPPPNVTQGQIVIPGMANQSFNLPSAVVPAGSVVVPADQWKSLQDEVAKLQAILAAQMKSTKPNTSPSDDLAAIKKQLDDLSVEVKGNKAKTDKNFSDLIDVLQSNQKSMDALIKKATSNAAPLFAPPERQERTAVAFRAPWAFMRHELDGVYKGTAYGRMEYEVPPGAHIVKLEYNDGKSVERRVAVARGFVAELDFPKMP